MQNNIILIQGAEDSEIDFLIEKLEESEKIVIGNYVFFKGKFKDKNIVISRTKVGEINSSAVTAIAIMKFAPIAIINQGTAGGYGENIHKGDIVVAENYIQINSFATESNEKSKRIEENINLKEFLTDDEIKNSFHVANSRLLDTFKKLLPSITDTSVHYGTVGSGDTWNKNKDIIKFLNEKYDILCEEMEIAGVYRIANNFNVPVISIRVISNNEVLKEKYEPEIAKNIQKIVYELAQKIEL